MAALTNVNYVGLHRFYRDRSMEAFMPDKANVKNNIVETSLDADTLSMADLWPVDGADKQKKPYPIINTNAIMINDPDRQLASRGGDSFIISPLYVGCAATGWESTKEHGRKHGPLSLASAMAASGAAVNANAAYAGAGITRDRLLSIVLMLLNLRLGMWVGRPSREEPRWCLRETNHYVPTLRYGLTRSGYTRHSKFVELSDGGHFDNLGIYELIRRKLSVILVIDGEEDPHTAMPALYSVAQRVAEDFGAKINLDKQLDELIPVPGEGYPEAAKFVKSPYFVTTIDYSSGAKGVLIYIKLSLVNSVEFSAKGIARKIRIFRTSPRWICSSRRTNRGVPAGRLQEREIALGELGFPKVELTPKAELTYVSLITDAEQPE